MQLTGVVDCLIPRGGPALIQSIRDNATVPVIIDGDGNCHVYVDASADLDQALDIVVNAKTQRPSVCNAAESLVVHEAVADAFLPRCQRGAGGTGRGAGRRRRRPSAGWRRWARPPTTTSAASSSRSSSAWPWSRRSTMRSRTSTGTDRATPRRSSPATSRRRRSSPPRSTPSTVVVNASTRFTDGAEFGFGAEIGISTQKLHARGPMALRELTTYKYVVWGDGQVRN